jgi:hypothetical protein
MVTTAAGELLAAGLLHGIVKNFVVRAFYILTAIYGIWANNDPYGEASSAA